MKENKKIISERKPADRTIGQHTFKGIRYDKNGNPIYTCDSLPDEQKKAQGWKYSPKHGLHGQISDPTKIHESKKVIKLSESKLRQIIRENLDEFIDGLRPGVRNGNKKFDIKNLFNDIERTLDEIALQCEHLEKLSRQIPDNDFEEELFEYAANMGNINRQATDKFWEATKGIPFNESKLSRIIKESIKKVLKESVEKTPIFGVHGVNITQDEGYEDYRITSGTYYSEDEAIEAAREAARSVADYEDVIEFWVIAGEYETPSGDVYGEPDAIYSISNKDEATTIAARKQAGFSRQGADEYIQ